MPYVDPFDLTTPADNTVVGLGDDRVRELKRALKERIESFFTGIDVDPWVPKAGVVGLTALANGDLPAGVKILAANVTDGNITTAKYAGLSITFDKIAAGNVRTNHHADSNDAAPAETAPVEAVGDIGITGRKLDSAAIIERHYATGSIPTAAYKDVSITSAKLADGAVTTAKLEGTVLDGLVKQFTGTLAIAAASGGITAQRFREWDVAVVGAVVGCRCEARFEPSSNPSGNVPTPAGTPANNADTGLIDHDTVFFKAWCLVADVVRVRIINPTNVNCPAEARTLRAYALVPTP